MGPSAHCHCDTPPSPRPQTQRSELDPSSSQLQLQRCPTRGHDTPFTGRWRGQRLSAPGRARLDCAGIGVGEPTTAHTTIITATERARILRFIANDTVTDPPSVGGGFVRRCWGCEARRVRACARGVRRVRERVRIGSMGVAGNHDDVSRGVAGPSSVARDEPLAQRVLKYLGVGLDAELRADLREHVAH
jgi:hypothetical protein